MRNSRVFCFLGSVLLGLALAPLGRAEESKPTQPGANWYNQDRGKTITDEGDLEESTAAKIALYPIRRLADFADIITIQIGFGLGLHANLHATRAMQAGAGGSSVSKLGLDGRHIGIVSETKSDIALLPFEMEYLKRTNALGNFVNYDSSFEQPWLYQMHRDYFEVGGEATVALINVTAGLHAREIPDALAGLVGFDLRKDDVTQKWAGQGKSYLSNADIASIKRLVIVPSRVVKARAIRMERESGIGCYYYRYPLEKKFGLIGAVGGLENDLSAQRELDNLLAKQDFDIQHELMDRAAYTLVFDRAWEVVGQQEILNDFKNQAVIKEHNHQQIHRLPNYEGLAKYYNADAVLDVRIWDWGVWRDSLDEHATIRLDCEYKLIKMPENKVLFNTRIISDQKDKKGLTLDEFTSGDGSTLKSENMQACDVVFAKLTDVLNEQH